LISGGPSFLGLDDVLDSIRVLFKSFELILLLYHHLLEERVGLRKSKREVLEHCFRLLLRAQIVRVHVQRELAQRLLLFGKRFLSDLLGSSDRFKQFIDAPD